MTAKKRNADGNTLNIYQRLSAVMSEVKYIKKSETSGSLKRNGLPYSFVSHDQVVSALQPKLVKHGIAVIPSVQEIHQEGNKTRVGLSVQFVNIDCPEDKVIVNFFGDGVDNQDKGCGKAYSYAFKYALLKTFCLETGDDDPESYNVEHLPVSKESLISSDQIQELEVLINGNEGLRKTVLGRCNGSFANLTTKQFPMVLQWVKKSLQGGQ